MNKFDDIKIPDNFDLSIDIAINNALNDKAKQKVRKRNNFTRVIFIGMIVLSISLNSNIVLAYIDSITKQIESFFDREASSFDKYKFDGLQVSESNGLKFNLGEVMIDDNQLIMSMSVDYSNFDFAQRRVNKKDLVPSFPTIILDEYTFVGQSNSFEVEKVKGEKKNNILLKVNLSEIDKDGDGISDTPFEILDNLKPDKNYILKVFFNELNTFYNGQYDPIIGDWEFTTKINISNIKKDTKVHSINENIIINESVYKGNLNIEEVRISPVSVKVKYNYDLYDELPIEKRREPTIIVKNQDGENLIDAPGTGGKLKNEKWYIGAEFNLNGDESKIEVIPVVYINNEPKILQEGVINLNIENLN